MRSSIYVPKRLNVGFQNRSGTYNGKLAYVIYFDEKGKLRKEKSWESWRDQSIQPEEYDNEPMEGFVLNKKVGDYASGWNHRQAYCRVWDPRGFEFEISIENLLYILENANCIKGKGLEGEFIYGWDGKDLILLPVDSPDYREIKSYTKKIDTNDIIKMKDLNVGSIYLDKDGNRYVYMGKHPKYAWGVKYRDKQGEIIKVKSIKEVPTEIAEQNKIKEYPGFYLGEYLWFACLYPEYKYTCGNYVETGGYRPSFSQYKGMPKKFISCEQDKPIDCFADLVDKMERCTEYSPVKENGAKAFPLTLEQFKQVVSIEHKNQFGDPHYYGIKSMSGFSYRIRKAEDGTYSAEMTYFNSGNVLFPKEELKFYRWGTSTERLYAPERDEDFLKRFGSKITEKPEKFKEYCFPSEYKTLKHKWAPGYTLEEMYSALEPCYIAEYLENGRVHRVHGDYLGIMEGEESYN